VKRPEGFDEQADRGRAADEAPVRGRAGGAGADGPEARPAGAGPRWSARAGQLLPGRRGTRGGPQDRGADEVASPVRSSASRPPSDVPQPDVRQSVVRGADASEVPVVGAPASRGADEARARAREARREARRASAGRRRAEKDEVRRFTRRTRHRRAAWLWSGGVLVGLLVAVAVTVFSPLLELRTITVEGADRVDATAVRVALEDQVGTPLALVDQDRVEQALEGFPLIASYVTETAPPHTLVVRLAERQPVAVVPAGERFELVDPAGIVLQQLDARPDGVPLVDVGAAPTDGPLFRAVTEVLLALPASLRATVDQATATTADDVTLTLTTGETVVWGSADRSARKAQVLAGLVADQGRRDPGAAVEYDVSAPDNGIIRTK